MKMAQIQRTNKDRPDENGRSQDGSGQPLGEKSSRRAGVSHQKCLVLPIGATFQKDRTGIVAALAGFPALKFRGFSTPTADAPIGVPVGMELLAALGRSPS